MAQQPRSFVDVLTERLQTIPDLPALSFASATAATVESWTFAGLARRVRTIAGLLQSCTRRGDRVLICHPPGLEFVATFLACHYAGAIPVPAFPPNVGRLSRSLPRLTRIADNAEAAGVASLASIEQATAEMLEPCPESRMRWLSTDAVPDEPIGEWSPVPLGPDDVALLQYTSGTTNDPRGVRVTHRNLLANSEVLRAQFDNGPGTQMVCWLPPYHDLGLVGHVLQCIYSGIPCVLMPPLDFVRSPLAWLRLISVPMRTTGIVPNFGYDLCVRKTSAEDREQLDLSRWDFVGCGAEVVRQDTLRAFADAFEVSGLRRRNIFPCYGLAENTLIASGERYTDRSVLRVDNAELARGVAQESRPSAAGGQEIVSCGRAMPGHEIRIVDPQTCAPVDECVVGEIWISGPSVADGYWADPEKSAATFNWRQPDRPHASYLRTGDLGFLVNDELFVLGRRTELIIVDGCNYYPNDLELTVERACSDRSIGTCVAFGVPGNGSEQLVVLLEVRGNVGAERTAAIFAAIRSALGDEHGVLPAAAALIRYGSVPRTSSGKTQRGRCREDYLHDRLKVVARWSSDGSDRRDDDGAWEVSDLANLPGAKWRRHDLMVAHLVDVVGAVLHPGDGHQVPTDAGFLEMGIDSVTAVEIRNRLQTDLGRELPIGLLFDRPTIESLATYLAGGGAAGPAPARTTALEGRQA